MSCAPPIVSWGGLYTVPVADTAGILGACLIRPGATTHAYDQDQRYVPLIFTKLGSPPRLLATVRANRDTAPPGDYMLFLTGSADRSDVPSIAKWVKIDGSQPPDGCDNTAPAAIADLSGCFHYYPPAKDSISLSWTAQADDGTLALSGLAKQYDIRYSQSPINNESNFASATPVSPAPPLPAGVGTLQTHLVGSFLRNHWYYFRMKTKDDQGTNANWSAMSNQFSIYTNTDCDGGEGFYGGSGGGGGGGSRARRVAERSSAQAVGGALPVENSLLDGARIGAPAIDTYRLAAAPRIENGAYAVRIRAAGVSAAAVDAARLHVVDHAPEARAYALGSGIATGNRIAAARATAGDDTDLAPALDGSGELVFAAGDVLTAELGPGIDNASGGAAVLVLEARSLDAGTETLGITVEVPESGGGWRALRALCPRRNFDEVAVEVGSASTLRVRFERSSAVRFVGRLDRAAELPGLQWAELLTARSSRSGEVAGVLAATDAATCTLVGPDTLALGFSVPPQVEGTVRDYFLEVDATPLTLRTSIPTSAAAARALPTRFALHQNQPNPFRARTTIWFELPVGAMVRLEVFDVEGRRLRVLADRYYGPGHQSVDWDKRATAGNSVGPGVYFYRIEAGPFRDRRQMVLLP